MLLKKGQSEKVDNPMLAATTLTRFEFSVWYESCLQGDFAFHGVFPISFWCFKVR